MAGIKKSEGTDIKCPPEKRRRLELKPSLNINDTTLQTEQQTELSVFPSLLENQSSDVSDGQTKNIDAYDASNAQQKIPSPKVNPEILLSLIDSTNCDNALKYLQEGHTFSQNALDNALISACQYGHKFLVQTLVNLGANVHTKDSNGNTPLMICAENGLTDLVHFLISTKADINATNSADDTALILSVQSSKSLETAKILLEQNEIFINYQNKEGYTALMKAVELGNIDVVYLVLKINHKDNEICSQVEPIIDHNNDSSDKFVNCRGETVKEISERCGLANIFGLLKQSITEHLSPLIQAVERSDLECFNILIDLQFLDPSEREHFFNEALRHIFKKYEKNGEETFTESETVMIQKLLENGADIKDDEYNGPSPLCIAVKAKSCSVVEILCKHGHKINESTKRSESGDPLNLAARLGRCDMVEVLLKYNTEIDLRTYYGLKPAFYWYYGSALHWANIYGQFECAKFLIEKGAQLDISRGCTVAIHYEDQEYLKFILENYEHEIKEDLRKHKYLLTDLLIEAIAKGNTDIIGQIIDAGANVNQSDYYKMKPLFNVKNGEVAEFLIQNGADVNQIIDVGQVVDDQAGCITPLIYLLGNAERYFSFGPNIHKIIKVLLENGACINARDFHCRTPLMLAAGLEDNESMLQMLLDHGAEVTDIDNEGNTAHMIAIHNDCTRNASFLIQFTGQNNGCLNWQDNKGSTALMYAVHYSYSSLVQELIDQGADVNIKNDNGNTALLCIAGIHLTFRAMEMVTSLINAGCDVNCQNSDGLSFLMLAVKNSRMSVSVLIKALDSGADINAINQNDKNKTMISYFLDCSFVKINEVKLELLLDQGPNCSYASPDILHRLIKTGVTKTIPKLIYHGLGPADIFSDDLKFVVHPSILNLNVSPLRQALFVGNVALAQYFIKNLFLTATDVTYLTSNRALQSLHEVVNQQSSLDFINEISQQPLTLFSLAFVSVSCCLGIGPERENRVGLLPLPQKIKDMLLFKTEEIKLGPVEENRTLTICQDV